MAQLKLNWRTNLIILAVFVAVGLLGLYLGSPVQRFREGEEATCRETCAKQQKASRLLPALPAGSVPVGKYDGPWSCKCY